MQLITLLVEIIFLRLAPRHRHADYNEDRENIQVKKKKKKKQWPVFGLSRPRAAQLVAGSATTENRERVWKVAVFPLVFRGLRNCNSVGFKWSFRTAIVIDSIIRRLFSPALSARGTRRETRERNAKNKLNRPRVTGVTSLSRNNFQSSQGSKLTSIREAINFLNYNFLHSETTPCSIIFDIFWSYETVHVYEEKLRKICVFVVSLIHFSTSSQCYS